MTEERDESMDTMANPDRVRQGKKDFSSVLWTHINATRRNLAECFSQGASKKDIMVADNHMKVLNSLVAGMSDDIYETDLAEFKLNSGKYQYRAWKGDRDMMDHHSLLIGHLENVIRLLGRKGEFPEEDAEMLAE